MLKITRQSLLNGTIVIEKEGTETVAATLNATIQEDGSSSINRFIQSNTLYLANRKAMDEDFARFDAAMTDMMKN
jgi:hypothetical protein